MKLYEAIKKIESRKKSDWEVIAPNLVTKEKVHSVVYRALQLRDLEIDVQGWTNKFNSQLTDDEYNYLSKVLDSHAKDEDKHSEVLQILADYWGGVEVSDEAEQIMELWRNLPGNEMAKKTFLEAGVFFSLLPLITQYSNNDPYTSRVADWIMSDEVRHVESARTLLRYFEIKFSKSYITAVEKTIEFLLQSEPQDVIERWKKRAVNIALKGDEPDFAQNSYRVVVGHFDQFDKRTVSNGYKY